MLSDGKSFIIDGRKLKSINQWFNKENTRLQSIKDKQHLGKKATNRQKAIARDRSNKVNDYMNKTAGKLINSMEGKKKPKIEKSFTVF